MTTESGSGGGISVWVWVAIAAGVLLLILGAFALFGVGGDDEAATTTVTDAPTTSTSEGETTTTEAETTTTEGETTTTTTPPTDVAETPVTAVLQPYNDGGAVLFPPGSVEAHWYQWDGQYILLYRGYDAEERLAICPGNSIETSPANWEFVSNSPFLLPADEICVDVPKLADPANGVRECGSLMYYITEIPTTAEGNLFGTLEQNDGNGFQGQTSSVAADLANTPEFQPEQGSYSLAPSNVDDGGIVICAS